MIRYTLLGSLPLDKKKKSISFDCIKNAAEVSANGVLKFNLLSLILNKFSVLMINTPQVTSEQPTWSL